MKRNLNSLEVVIFFAVIFILGVLTYSRNMVWQDDLTLWSDAFRKAPGKVRTTNNLAKALIDENNCQDAIEFLKMAIEKDPHYAEPHYNLGLCYVRSGRYERALESFKKVVDIMEVLLRGHYGEPPSLELLASSHGYIANIYTLKGEYQKAVEHFKDALKYAPESVTLHYNLALTLKRAGRRNEAIEEFKRVLELNPGDQGARWNLLMLQGSKR